jgi:N-acetylmuramoyl-L-alanine amidase
MIKKVFRTGLIAACLGGAGVSLAATPSTELTDIELAATRDGAQLTLDLTGVTSQRIFRLSNPDRTVVDLAHTRLARGAHAPPGEGLVEDVRTGVQPGGVVRVVVRVKSSVGVRSAWVDPGGRGVRRLIVTLGEKPAEPQLAVAAPRAVATPRAEAAARGEVGAPTTGDVSPRRGAAPAVPVAVVPVVEPRAGGVGTMRVGSAGTPATYRIVRAAHAPSDSGRDVIIAVDAGHGGQDPGAIGHAGTQEKNVTLPIARELAERINGEPGMRAVLTRNRDEFLVLRDRIHRARVAKADMFISIHADSIADRAVSGASVYVLSEKGATNESARWLAERENAADLMGGVKLDDKDNTLASVLLDLSNTANISASIAAAEGVITSLDNVGQVRKPQVQQAAFVVLKSPDIPSMLVETAYISNPADELRLRNTREQDKLAEAIFQGVKTYFAQNPPAGTRFAQERHGAVALATSAASR